MAPARRLPRRVQRTPTSLGSGQGAPGGGAEDSAEEGGTDHSCRWREAMTMPNAVSALGLVLTLRGAAHLDSPRGLLQAAAGRTLDVVDGALARQLGQASSLGAVLDAGFDKVAVAALIAAAWRHRLVPRPALVAIAAQNLLNGAATAGAEVRTGREGLTTVRDGKLAMAWQNVAMATYALASVISPGLRRAPVAGALRVMGHVAIVVGVGHFGVRASAAYLQRTGIGLHSADRAGASSETQRPRGIPRERPS